MKLAAYLERERITPTQFAERMGKPASTISRILKGERQAGIDLLSEIYTATGGAVSPNDFLPSSDAAKRKRGKAA